MGGVGLVEVEGNCSSLESSQQGDNLKDGAMYTLNTKRNHLNNTYIKKRFTQIWI